MKLSLGLNSVLSAAGLWLILALLSSFLFSGMEAGVFALNRLRIRRMMRSGDPRAAKLWGFLQRPEHFLWTILVGNTLSNLVANTLLILVLHRVLGEQVLVFVLAAVVVVFLQCALCDLLPKMIFRRFPNRLCLWLARPFALVHVLFRPIVGVASGLAKLIVRWTGGRRFEGRLFHTRDEMMRLMGESSTGFSKEEKSLISRVLDLQNQTVANLALPLAKCLSVDLDTPVKHVFELARERGSYRLPVWDLTTGNQRIAGFIYSDHLLFDGGIPEKALVRHYVQPALFLPETATLEEALRRMQKSGQRMAIILGQDQREAAVLALTDILKFLFGEVQE